MWRRLNDESEIYGGADLLPTTRTRGQGREGRLPFDEDMLLNEASGNLFAMTQNVAMGWHPEEVNREQYVIVSTKGGLRAEDGSPVALGYHTGHWEISLLVQEAAETLRARDAIPFAIYCSDPCDGRSQGTTGMMDSLAYRNDAALVMRRMIRSLPTRDGVMGVATCDKGLPAAMIALAGCGNLPGIIVPGGVTLPAEGAEDAGTVQTIGARFAHGMITSGLCRRDGLQSLRLFRRRLPVFGDGCHVAGCRRSARLELAALRPGALRRSLSGCDNARRSALALLNSESGWNHPRRHHHAGGAGERDAGAFGVWRLDQLCCCIFPAIAHAAGLTPPIGRRLDPRQSQHIAPGGRLAQWTAQSSDGAGLHGWRRARSHAASASPWACSTPMY